jgi:hypothetical protein
VGAQSGLIWGLAGLAPAGGEPQLWLVRALPTRLTLRCGWLATQEPSTFETFLQPIRDLGWPVGAVMSDKQRGLVPAVSEVFGEAKHAFCHRHYLNTMAAPVCEADAKMQVPLRKQVRQDVGELIRRDTSPASPGVLTVPGLIPSPVVRGLADPPPDPAPPLAEVPRLDGPIQAREAIVDDRLRRVRYLLTRKGRPPFRLAGIAMFARRSEVAACVDRLGAHHADARLVQLRQG